MKSADNITEKIKNEISSNLFVCNEPENSEIYIEHKRFVEAGSKIIGKRHDDKGIGTLSEKTVHAVLKLFFEPDEDYHEVAVDGYFADICNCDGIVEIQTRQFNKLRDKLTVFLENYPVTIVYPIPADKWVSWVDRETGCVTGRRKSPARYSVYNSFAELYKIKAFLRHPNISFRLVFMDMEEYKLLDGWDSTKKKGATRYDRIPLGIRRIVSIDRPEDYMQFVPYELPEEFTAKDFAVAAGINRQMASLVLNILNYVNAVTRIGKKGNSYVYRTEE